MTESQEELREWFYERPETLLIALWSRRGGKTFGGAGLVHECALATPNARIRIASGTGIDVKENVEPAMEHYTQAAPAWARPEYSEAKSRWDWPHNGSRAIAAGVNSGQEDRLRGRACGFFWVEEGGVIDRLRYLLISIARPQVLTTGGKILVTMTPPDTPAHDSLALCTEAEADGRLIRRTIYEIRAPHMTRAAVASLIADMGGPESTDTRRELFCEFVTDAQRAVVPEFQREESAIVEERERPSHFIPLVAMDIGFSDLTVAVLGYYDFRAGLDVITHEVVCRHSTSDVINAAVQAAELEAFGEGRKPTRYVDASEITVADLCRLRGMTKVAAANDNGKPWLMAPKDDAEAALNALRLRIGQRKLRIHPRCTATISHLRHAIWNKARTSFERSGDHGHFDAVDACKYFVRTLNRATNPYPLLAPGVKRETHRIPERDSELQPLVNALRGKR